MMRKALIVLWMLLVPITTASAQVSIGIGLPGISIGINLPVYPQLVPVPGYPVYYAPQLNSNYFFYDGMYWVYQQDNWYASSWYNGPWMLVAPGAVPLFILRIPVGYYRYPPAYFYGWSSDAPPHWGDHWGHDWEQSHRGWDDWDRRAVPAPAPLPIYQRQYSGERYPRASQQQVLERQHYRYQPRDPVVRQHFQAQQVQRAPAASPPARQAAPQPRRPPQQGQGASGPPSSRPQAAPAAPRTRPQQEGGGEVQRPAAAKAPATQARPTSQPQARQPQQGGPQQHQQQAPKPQGQDKGPQGKGPAKEPKQGQEQRGGKGEQRGGKGEQPGGEHNQ